MSRHDSSVHAQGFTPTATINTFPPNVNHRDPFYTVEVIMEKQVFSDRSESASCSNETDRMIWFLYSIDEVDNFVQALIGAYNVWKEAPDE